jgi:hypothetical protein
MMRDAYLAANYAAMAHLIERCKQLLAVNTADDTVPATPHTPGSAPADISGSITAVDRHYCGGDDSKAAKLEEPAYRRQLSHSSQVLLRSHDGGCEADHRELSSAGRILGQDGSPDGRVTPIYFAFSRRLAQASFQTALSHCIGRVERAQERAAQLAPARRALRCPPQ